MVVIIISLGRTPGGVPIDGGTAEVEDSHELEGEDTGRSRSRAVYGRADQPYIEGEKSWKYDLNTQGWIQSLQLLIQSRIQSLKERINQIQSLHPMQCRLLDIL